MIRGRLCLEAQIGPDREKACARGTVAYIYGSFCIWNSLINRQRREMCHGCRNRVVGDNVGS